MIGMRRIISCFEDGNVCVTGLRGRGKDLLMANVIARRRLPYVSNMDYSDDYIPFKLEDIDCGKNGYKNFIEGDIKYYSCPYEDGTDIYISDVGVYFPAQYCNELNRDYKYLATYLALSRHTNLGNVHTNCQNLNRIYDKIREQSDTFIRCEKCWYFHGYVAQIVTIYDLYESCVLRVKPFAVRLPLLCSREMRQAWEMERERYEQKFGRVERRLLIYKNKSTYNTRRFKDMLEGGRK